MRATLEIRPSESVPPSFPEMLEQLWQDRHTGPVVIHFANGRPNVVEIQTSKVIRLETR